MVRQFDLPLLVGAAIRRLQQLNTCYGTTPWLAPMDTLFDDARAAQIDADQMCWVDWDRISGATGQTMQLGGMVGVLDVRGMTPAHPALLMMASAVHVGKAAVFGNGWFRLKPRTPTS